MRFANDTWVVATRNRGKSQEFAAMFAKLGIRIRDLNDYSGLPDIVEDGESFAENAEKKAAAIAKILRLPVLADDSGLCVDALAGAPGVFSARYAGEPSDDQANNRKLLHGLAKEPPIRLQTERGEAFVSLSGAEFVCVLALHDPENEETLFAQGAVRGHILPQPRGEGGFGYDPLFYLPQFGQTMAEISAEQKNRISHRGQALQALLKKLAD